MKTRLLGLVLLIVVAAFALLGCGGGGASSSGSTESAGGGELTKAELISKGDQICTETQEETDPIKQEFEEVFEGGEETHKAFVEGAEIFRKAIPPVEAEAEALRQLEPPSGDAATINTMLDDLEESSEPLESVADAVEGDEEAKVEEISKELEAPNRRAKAIAKAYGFKVCGKEEAA